MAEDVTGSVSVRTSHSQLDPLDELGVVIDQRQPHAPVIASEPGQHHLRSVYAQGAVLVAQLSTHCSRKGARVARKFLRKSSSAQLYVKGVIRAFLRHDPVQQIAAREQVEYLTCCCAPIVYKSEVSNLGKRVLRNGAREGVKLLESPPIPGCGEDQEIGPESGCFGCCSQDLAGRWFH